MIISNYITKYILNHIRQLNQYDEDDIDVMRYSLEAVLWELEKTIILFVVFGFLGKTGYFAATLIAMISIRIIAGGYHSQSSTICLLISFFGFVLAIFVLPEISLNNLSILLLSVFSLAATILIAPLGSLERASVQKKDTGSHGKILVSIITFAWLVLIYIFKDHPYAYPVLWIIVLQNIQLVFEYFRRKGEKA